ncbi:amidohydrolase family protein [Streptomyces sp. bgisy034]|uniref:amidohydrolase family protein n=1 Tax=Streptomyces sp. bgisy034 TaxID=3413774 RepID=UPI003EBB028F
MFWTDVHHHWIPPSLERALAARSDTDGRAVAVVRAASRALPSLTDLAAQQDELTAAQGGAVLSLPPIGPAVDGRPDAGALLRSCNDELIDAVGSGASFVSAMVALPLPDVEQALTELGRIGSHPAVSGVMVYTTPARPPLDDPCFKPVWAAVAELGLPLFLHPEADPLPQFEGWRLGDSLAPPVSTSLQAARMMLSGVLDRVPLLTLIIPHLGGVLPYLTQRLVDLSGAGDGDHDVLHYLRHRVYLDTCSFHEPALRCALDTVGAERLLLGSDYPFRGPVTRCVNDITSADLVTAEREAILKTNASILFASGHGPSSMADR